MRPEEPAAEANHQEPSGSSFTARDFFLFVALPVVALWLRTGVFWQSLWYDEILTARVSAVPFKDSLTELAAHNTWHPPLYYWINHLVLLVTDHDWANRLVALAFGLAVFPLMYRFARRFMSEYAAYLCLLLLAISPIHVHSSHDAREYTLFFFVSIWALDRLLAALEDNKFNQWAAFCAFTALAMYSSFFAFFAIIGQSAFLLVRQAILLARQRRLSWSLITPLLKFAACNLLALLAYAPVLPIMLSRLGGNISPTGVKNTAIHFSWFFFKVLLAKYGCGLGVPLWIMGGVFLIGLVIAAFKKPWLFVLAVTTITASILPFFLILSFSREQFFSFRYVIFLLPIFLVLVSIGTYTVADLAVGVVSRFAKGLARWRPQLALTLAGAVMVAAHASSIFGMFVETNEELRGVCQFIAKHQAPGDMVVLQADYANYAFQYYQKGLFEVAPVSENDTATLRKLCAEHKRVWFVGTYGFPTDRFGNELEQLHFLMIFDQGAEGVRLDIYDADLPKDKMVSRTIEWRELARTEMRYHPNLDVLLAHAYREAGNEAMWRISLARAIYGYRVLTRSDTWLLTDGFFSVMLRVGYGEVLREAGHLAEAGAVLRTASHLYPEKTYILYSLALVEMDRRNFAEAAALLEKKIKHEKHAPHWELLKLAESYAGCNEMDKAITVCREGYLDFKARKNPYAPVLGARRAELADEAGAHSRAIDICKEIIRSYPDYAHAYSVLAHIYHNANSDPEAMKALEDGLQNAPDNEELLKARMDLGSVMKQDANALFPANPPSSKSENR